MKLIRQMIEKKLENYGDYSAKKKKLRAIWQFYQAVNLCIAFLKFNNIEVLNEKEIRKRNSLYQDVLLKRKLDEYDTMVFDNFITNDLEIITRAFKLLDEIKEESNSNVLSYDRLDFIAILGAEVEDLL